jgi:cytoskeletal protein CcmA (bactofilin family)
MKNKEQTVINPNSVNMIVNSTEIKGNINTESDIKFDGKLEGILNTKSKLVLGAEGIVIGEVFCKNAVISGRIEGKITVEELLTLTSTSQIKGEVITNKIAIEPGAILNGNCTMNGANNKPVQ